MAGSVSFLPATIGTDQMASLLGVSRQRVNALARKGVIPKEGRGQFNPLTAIPAYCAWLRDNHERKADNDALQAEKLRLVTEQADKAAIANAKARGEVINAKEVESAWVAFCVDLRARLLAMPARIASRANLSRDAAKRLDDELRLAMGDLADD